MRFIIAAGLACLGACASHPEAAADSVSHLCLISVQEDGGALAQVDLATGAQKLTPIGLMPHEVEISPNSVFAYVSQFGLRDANHSVGVPGDHITEVNLVSGATRTFTLPSGATGPHGVRLHNGELFTNAEVGDQMVVFDAGTGAVKRSFAIPALVHHFLFSREGDIIAFAAANGVYKLDAQDGHVIAHADIGSPARSVFLTHGGSEVLVAARGEVVFLNVSDLSVARRVPVSGVTQIIYATIDERAGLIFAPAPAENVVVALDLATGAERARITPGRTPTMAIPGPDGRVYIPAVGETYITAVDTSTFATTQIGTFQRPNGLAFGACPQN
jgi:DNA-binding beta-propeller fold protein YncE